MPNGGLDPELERLVADAYDKGAPIPMLLAQQAAQAGSVKGMVVHGIGLGNTGRLEEAEQWLQRARLAGDGFAMLALGTIYLDQGDLEPAERYFREAQMNGQAGAANALSALRASRK
jgi:TPR repeat protein